MTDLRKTVMDNCSEMIFSLDPMGKLTLVNRRFCQFVSQQEQALEGCHFEEIGMNSALSFAWKRHFEKVLETKAPVTFESILLTPSGDDRCYKVTMTPMMNAAGEFNGISGYQQDITQQKRHEKTIRKLAYQDALTGLPNRTLFMDRLSTALSIAERNSKKAAVLFIDLDDFKTINDTLGHVAGDELLMQAAQRMLTCTRAYDTVSRLSGDEFAIILQDLDQAEDVIAFITRLNSRFEKPLSILKDKLHITMSIGVAVFPDDSQSVEELMRHADTAMARAKAMGKNMYQYFNITMKEDILKRMNIEGMLRQALSKDEFILHYQPQYAAKGKRLRGFEALIRWQHPLMGLISPAEFIPCAESTGLIVDIGKWALHTACRMCKVLEVMGGVPIIMAVNISTIQLRHKQFFENVMEAIHSAGIAPSSLELEITESVVIDDYEYTEELLSRLRQEGIRIALDDFGTGYSSLSYLKKLPIDLLKIDRSFVGSIDLNNTRQDLTESIISLVHRLDIETMAEGVETVNQMEHLINVECDHMQGFYFSRPIAEAQLQACLSQSLCEQDKDPEQ